MKKLIVSALFLVLTFSVASSLPAEVCNSSGLKTSDEAISTHPGLLCGIEIVTNGTNAASVIVYDNSSAASGTVLFKGTISGASNFGGGFVNVSVRNGIYVDVSGTEAAYIVYFQ